MTDEELERLIDRGQRETAADIAELRAQLATSVQQLSAQIDRYVLREVYEADERARAARESALAARIGRVEDELTNARRSTRNAVLTAITSVVASVAAAVLIAAILRGGH